MDFDLCVPPSSLRLIELFSLLFLNLKLLKILTLNIFVIIVAKNIPVKLHHLIENEKGSHFFLDEAFGIIGHDELKEVDGMLSNDFYFWIAYQRAADAPGPEKLSGK